jgi:hypothetical protein
LLSSLLASIFVGVVAANTTFKMNPGMGMRPGIILLREGTDTSQVRLNERVFRREIALLCRREFCHFWRAVDTAILTSSSPLNTGKTSID